MPWYWTDEVASVLMAEGRISAEVAIALAARPVAYRYEQESLEDAARALLDDGEIPLAA